MQISVRNVTWDLMLKKAYLDFGTPCDNSSAFDSDWDSGMEKGTYTDGVVNDPSRTGSFACYTYIQETICILLTNLGA